jgi:hypothetical protein
MRSFFLSLSLAGAGIVGFPNPPSESAQVGDPAPEVGGEWLQSPAESLAEMRGRVVLIEFWRTW